MQIIIILVVLMAVVGVIIGWLAEKIWKDGRTDNYKIAVISCIVIGLMDWYLIPMILDSELIKYIGVAMEPALGALFILWLVRKAKK